MRTEMEMGVEIPIQTDNAKWEEKLQSQSTQAIV